MPGQRQLPGLAEFLLLAKEDASGPGSYDIETRLKEEASLALRKCPYSRYEVAARMSEMLGQEITKTMLDNRTAESKESHLWPAAWLAPFAHITGHHEQLCIVNRLARIPAAETEKIVEMEIKRLEAIVTEEQKKIEDLRRMKGLIVKNGKR